MSLPLFIKTSKDEKNKNKEICKCNEHCLKEDRRSHHEPAYHDHKYVTSDIPFLATKLR